MTKKCLDPINSVGFNILALCVNHSIRLFLVFFHSSDGEKMEFYSLKIVETYEMYVTSVMI